MASLRWRKLRGDLRASRGRVAVMVAALAVSLIGFGAVLGARAVLERAIAASYLGSQPADATLELAGGVDAAVLDAVRARPEIAAAAAREAVVARVRTGRPGSPAWEAHLAAMGAGAPAARSILLFVEDDLDTRQVTTVHRVSGAWPPPAGAMLIERSSLPVLGVGEGDTVTVTTPHGAPRAIAIAGVVHDAGLAPAWQEHRGVGYLTRATLAALGEPAVLHDLCVRFAPAPASQADAEAAARALARWLTDAGHPVHRVRVPALRRHPHFAQMATAQLALLVFGVLLVVLSAVLIATLLAALLARQVREIGVMKALGARSIQLAVMYAGYVAVIGGLALAIALPLAGLGGHAFVDRAGAAMNLAIADATIPGWVFAVVVASGLAVPLAVAAVPIARACRRTVRDALADHGTRAVVRLAPTWLPRAARNALRTPARLALSIGLLATGGAMAITAVNVKRAYERNVDRMPAMWHHDVDFALSEPAPIELAGALAAVPGVRAVEAWGDSAAAWQRDDASEPTATTIDVVHTYPDQGHGSFHVYGAPPATTLATLPLIAGRWLTADDTDAIVMSRGRGVALGDRVRLSLDSQPSSWTVVGLVDPLPLGAAFVRDARLAAAIRADGKARLLRVGFAPGADPASVTAELDRVLARAGAPVEQVIPFAVLHAALDDHVLVITRIAVVLAALIALIGLFGLGAAMGISVTERTREIGVLKAIGASGARILGLVVGEAMLVGAASWVVAVGVAMPVTHLVDHGLSAHGFVTATFAISPAAIAGWLVAVVVGSAVASFVPARRAARMTVREALAEP